MNLHRLLQQRQNQPIQIGLIGAGKFATMFLAQLQHTPGMQLAAIADLNPERAIHALQTAGFSTTAIDECWLTDDSSALIKRPTINVVIDATGSPIAGVRHVLGCCEAGKHILMVNVEADALVGPWLAQQAAEAGIVYSLAYGDQPALIVELVDWARAAGFPVVAAGKGTKYLPSFHCSTPDTVWEHYGLTPEQAGAGGMNPQMFNSFLDGTKSAIEMAAVANATGLLPPENGLAFPPCGVDDLPQIFRPEQQGGLLSASGQVEVVSSLERDGRPVYRDLRWGVYVVIEAPSDYAARCFAEYGLHTDPSGRFAANYRPYHLIGLELGISVASMALRGEATGSPDGFRGDVVAVAKRPLRAGEILDGEGGFTVWGKLCPATTSLAQGYLPIGLAHGVTLCRDIASGNTLTWQDVKVDEQNDAVRARRAMEAALKT